MEGVFETEYKIVPEIGPFPNIPVDKDKRYGSECSGAVWGNYIFLGDNGGTIFCIDLNTMKMIWAQEVKEDVNSSPILPSIKL